MAVTPVRTSSPSTSVAWPTRTPATSVIAHKGPGGNTPILIPKSRALGRLAWLVDLSSPDTWAHNAISPHMSMAASKWVESVVIARLLVGWIDVAMTAEIRGSRPALATNAEAKSDLESPDCRQSGPDDMVARGKTACYRGRSHTRSISPSPLGASRNLQNPPGRRL